MRLMSASRRSGLVVAVVALTAALSVPAATASATDDPDDAIPCLPAVSVRSQLCDFAGKFEPGNVLRCARWCRILT